MDSPAKQPISMPMRLLLAIFIFALLATPVFAVLQNGSIKIFAVTDDQKGMAADLFIYTVPGTGKTAFITSNSLVGKDTQTTGNIALGIVENKTGIKLTDKDIIFDIRANASEVDGPSAGAAMTLLAYSMFTEQPLAPEVALTGTINSDGSIGMVGGVGAKAQAASKVGIKLFMIPTGEAVSDIEDNGTFETVNMLEYGPQKLGMKIVEVSQIDQAIKYAYSNIGDIKVDSNVSVNIFIPEPISYASELEPMKKISQDYIANAKATMDAAKKSLDQSKLPDSTLADYYQQYGAASRGVEMAKRFLDQNYLYSSANYAFNSQVLAGTIKEIADNPSLLSADSTILNSKVSSLRNELAVVKQKSNFIPLDDFEWVIGAQQRLAYAENALDKLSSSDVVSVDITQQVPASDSNAVMKDILFQRVYDYVSAEAWISVAKDFLLQAQSSQEKKIPVYTRDFIDSVNKKISDADALIKDSNVSSDAIAEATRRLDSAKLSRDNNFLFAALYDASFAESFISSELSRKNMTADELFNTVETDVNSDITSGSIWGNLFFDHAKFYYQNALFNKKLARSQDVEQSIDTSYDLIYLSKNLDEAKSTIEQYLAFTPMSDYVAPNEPVIGVTYNNNKSNENLPFLTMAFAVLIILFVILVLVIGSVIKSRKKRVLLHSRHSKLKDVLGNLENAFSKKKISQSEYFFLKKKYENEISHQPNVREVRLLHNLSLGDLRSKLRALENGMADLRRHYKEGLMISEDYLRQYRQVSREIEEVKAEIKAVQKEADDKKKSLQQKSSKRHLAIKGTEELAEEEEKDDAKEKAKRKKILRRYAYKSEK